MSRVHWLAQESEVNQAAFDGWSAVHALTGATLGLTPISPWLALGGSLVYEIIEYQIEKHPNNFFATKAPESMRNIITDTALFMLAFGLARAAIR